MESGAWHVVTKFWLTPNLPPNPELQILNSETFKTMDPESAIEASREAIKVCFTVGGPILAVCLIVGLLMGLAQAMSHIQDQALATVPKILAILAVVGFALPWFADRMMEFSKDQFSRPFLGEVSAATWPEVEDNAVQSLLVEPTSGVEGGYYPTLNAPRVQSTPIARHASFKKQAESTKPTVNPSDVKSNSSSPFSLPSYRFSRRPSENIEG